MPNYPSNFANNPPFDLGPQNNINVTWQVRNRLLRHNIIHVDRILNTDQSFVAWSGSVLTTSNYQLSGSTMAFNHGHVVVLAGQTDATQNGIYRFESGSIQTPIGGNYSGPGLVRVASLTQAGVAIYAESDAEADSYLNNLWYHTGPVFGHTGSLATGPNSPHGMEDAAGLAYPQGFIATSGSNADKIIYFTQDQWTNVGTDGIRFSTLNTVSSALPSSRTDEGTGNIGAHTDTMEDFFQTSRVFAEMLDLINEFRDGGATIANLNDEKRAFLANMSSGKLKTMKGMMEATLPQLYKMYHFMFQLGTNYNSSTGSRYPTGRERGFNVFNDVP
jgi:hypothetical protein